MEKKCKKCKSDCEQPGAYINEGGKTIYLCAFCWRLFDKLPTGLLNAFLRSNGHELIKSPISRDILLARIRRSKKKLIWS